MDSFMMEHEPEGRPGLVCVWETILMVVESESVTVNTEGCIIVWIIDLFSFSPFLFL